MTIEDKKTKIGELYDSIKGYQYKQNAEIYYNLIKAKSVFGLKDYHQSLYLDIKLFVQNYMAAANKADYGYDELLLDKIVSVAKCLDDVRQQKSILCTTRRKYIVQGYDTDDISEEIDKLEIKVALSDNNYLSAIRLYLGSNLWVLLISYAVYIMALCVILLPAPYQWMGIFNVELKTYSEVGFFNHIANTLMLLCGSEDMAPSLVPNGVLGVVVYSLGVLLFYFFFANFIFKKIEDFLTIK